MKNISITVADGVYQKAQSRAAAEDTSISRVVRDFLCTWTGPGDRSQRNRRLDRVFNEADRRDRRKKGSAGPFTREDVYAGRLARFH